MWRIGVTGILALATLLAPPARADDVADFYKGKRINLIVSYGTGGGYDVYARVLARHMGRHIPGNPSIIIQNMPGAGSLRGANYHLQRRAQGRHRLRYLCPQHGAHRPAQDQPERPVRSEQVHLARIVLDLGQRRLHLLIRRDAKVKSVEEARRAGGPPIILGSTAEGASSDAMAILLREWLGFNVKVIPGYTDSGVLFLAIERGEVEGRTVGLSAVRANKPDWLKPGGLGRILVVFGRATRHPDFPDAPTARELARNAEDRNLIEVIEIPYALSRPFAAPPGVPRIVPRRCRTRSWQPKRIPPI